MSSIQIERASQPKKIKLLMYQLSHCMHHPPKKIDKNYFQDACFLIKHIERKIKIFTVLSFCLYTRKIKILEKGTCKKGCFSYVLKTIKKDLLYAYFLLFYTFKISKNFENV